MICVNNRKQMFIKFWRDTYLFKFVVDNGENPKAKNSIGFYVQELRQTASYFIFNTLIVQTTTTVLC